MLCLKNINCEKLRENIEKRMAKDLAECNVNGASVLVMQNGKTVYRNIFGLASNDSLYRMASMTKPVTAVAVMTLYDKKLLSIEDPVEKYLPEFSDLCIVEADDNNHIIKSSYVKNIPTIKHLLTHTSGILAGRSGAVYLEKMTPEDDRTLSSAVKFYSECGLDFEPFSKQEYSATAAFDVLAKIVETVSGQDYNEYLQQYIFRPLNMKDTTFVPSQDQWNRIIPMHDRINGHNAEGITYKGCVFEKTPVTHYLGGAGLISSLEDYSAFANMLLGEGELSGTRILSEDSVKLISQAHVPREIMDMRERWGLGVRVITKENYKLPVGTFGWSGAYGTHFWVDPKNMITAVYLKNSRFDGGSGAVTSENFESDVFNSLE